MISNLTEVPPNWIKVRFDEIAGNIADRIDKPNESGLEYYIGLDHLDTDQIRIKRFGSTEDVKATKFLCKKGDIIFGKRNAYLRKIAVTDRDAVVSAHSMVIRPKGDSIVPEFLPCFMQSSIFWKTAHAISEGSMSPTIKWKTLAKQEFWIPTIEEQKKIAEILWSIEDTTVKNEGLISTTEVLKEGLFNELLTKGIAHEKFKKTEIGDIPENWNVACLNEIVDLKKPKATPPYRFEKYVALEHIDSNETTQMNFGSAENVKSITNIFETGDLLYGKLRPYLNKASIANFDGICSTEILVLNANKKTSNEFLIIYLKSDSFIKHNINLSFGTKMPRTSFKIISIYKIPLPPKEEQNEIIDKFSRVDSSITKLVVHSKNLNIMKKKLTNDYLSGKLLIPKEVL